MHFLNRKFPRRSNNPSKNLLWIWLLSDLEKLPDLNICIDAACGPMQLFPQLKVNEYVGFDIDESSIVRGLSQFPLAAGFKASIEDVLTIRPDLKSLGDLVLCIQTLGINSKFNPENIVLSILNLIQMTAPGGSLIMNIRFSESSYTDNFYKIRNLLKANFSDLKYKNYGSFDKLNFSKSSNLTKMLVLYPLSLLLYWLKPLRTLGLFENKSTYFVCKNKIV